LKRFNTLIYVCCALFMWKGHSFAQKTYVFEKDTVYTVYQFEEVVVYGKKYRRPPSMITEIDTLMLRAGNKTDVAAILREEPGLVVSTGTKGDTRTRIRGFHTRDVLVLVDGYPVNTGYYGKVDLSMVPAENIAKIKIIKGPSSVAYGANSMGGVINIITKSSFDDPLTSVSAEAGENSFYRINVNHSRTIGRFSYSLFAYNNHSDGFSLSNSFTPTPYEDGGIRDNSLYTKSGIAGKFGFKYSKKVTLGLGIGYHWAEKGCPSTTSILDLPRYCEFPEWRRINVNLNGDVTLSPSASLKTVVFLDSQGDRYKSYSTADMSDDNLVYDSLLENWTTGGSVSFHIHSGSSRNIITGMSFRRDLMNKKPDVNDPWYSHQNVTGSFFAEISGLVFEHTSITAGTGLHLFTSSSVSDGVAHLSPMISINQDLPWKLNATCSWSNAMRFPTMHHLYSTVSGNESLKPEEADKIEAGVSRTFFIKSLGSTTAEVVWFDNSLDNMIYRATRTYIYENIKSARLCGAEARITWKLSPSFSVTAGYTHLNGNRSTDELLEEAPQNRFSLALYAKTGFGTVLHISYNTYSDIITYISGITLDDYSVQNLSISQYIWSGFNFTIRANNLFDTDYEEELGYPGYGRQILAGFSWRKQ